MACQLKATQRYTVLILRNISAKLDCLSITLTSVQIVLFIISLYHYIIIFSIFLHQTKDKTRTKVTKNFKTFIYLYILTIPWSRETAADTTLHLRGIRLVFKTKMLVLVLTYMVFAGVLNLQSDGVCYDLIQLVDVIRYDTNHWNHVRGHTEKHPLWVVDHMVYALGQDHLTLR